MRKSYMLAVLGTVGIVGALLLIPVGQAVSAEIIKVVVENWPATQVVEGEIAVTNLTPLAKPVLILEIVVPPVPRHETTRLIDAGTLETEGYPGVVLSLHGEVRGETKRMGSVGVILLPDEDSIQEAFDEQGMFHFTLETEASGITAKTPYFASRQPRYSVAFSTYRVLLYNTTDKTVTANLYAYLTQ